MLEFIKYCLWCVGIFLGGSLGQNPEGMSLKTGMIGFVTLVVLFLLLVLILYFAMIVYNKFK